MIEELSCLNYYSSGFKLDSLSYSKKDCIKSKLNIEIKKK